MRRGFKIVLIIIGALLGLMLVIPLAMKSKIDQMVKLEANELLDARFDFEDLSISLFRNFPDASILVKNVSIVGNKPFEGDTLMSASKIQATVNILSLLGNSGFKIEEVLIDDPLVQGLVNAQGKANWEIVRSKPEEGSEKRVEADESALTLHLKKFRIKNASIRYKDIPAGTDFDFEKMDLQLSGNMDADRTDLQTNLEVGSASVMMDHTTYVKEMRLSATINMDADLANKRFTFKENQIGLNAIKTSFDGWIAFPDSTQMDMDLKLNTSQITFREMLSLVPAIYRNDFDKLKAEGSVRMDAMAKGILKRGILPVFKANMTVENGAFHYTHFNESVSDIQIHAQLESGGGSLDQVKASVDKLHFLLAGNPFDMTASATRFKTDMLFDMTAFGKIDLSKLKEVYPLPDSLMLDGILTTDLKVAGSMAQIDKKQYDQLAAQGKLQLDGFDLKRTSGEPLAVRSAILVFTPKFVELQAFDASMGKNNVRMTGRLEQFIPYVLKKETLKGSLQITSDYLCVNDFMTPADSVQVASTEIKADSVAPHLLVIPANLDLTTELSLKEVVMDKIRITDVKGKMQVKGGKAILNGITFNAFDGSVGVAGIYDSTRPETPTVDMGLQIQHASFAKTFQAISSLQKMAPIFENTQGTYVMTLGLKSRLLPGMTPDLKSVDANGSLQSSDVRISGVAALDKLADALKYPALKEIAPKNLDLKFKVRDGLIHIDPFEMRVGDIAMTLGGNTGLDQTIDYTGTITPGGKGLSILGLKIKSVPFKITGTFKSPQVTLDTKAIGSSLGSDVKDAVKDLLKGLK
ncbi:MAG: AsmA-like C-terminal region-containing protein [Bacteroidales bacterium]